MFFFVVFVFVFFETLFMGLPGNSVGKESPAMQETPIGFLGQEDPLKKG